jgi:hypothetical protein
MRYALPIPILAIAFLLSGQSLAADIDWAKVDAALGKTASAQGEVHRYGIPRSDLQVTQRFATCTFMGTVIPSQ